MDLKVNFVDSLITPTSFANERNWGWEKQIVCKFLKIAGFPQLITFLMEARLDSQPARTQPASSRVRLVACLETLGPEMIALFSHFILPVSVFIESLLNLSSQFCILARGWVPHAVSSWLVLSKLKMAQLRLPRAKLLFFFFFFFGLTIHHERS